MDILARLPALKFFTPLDASHRFVSYYCKIGLFILIFSFCPLAQATVFTFDLRSAESAILLDDLNVGELVRGGLTGVFTSLPGGNNAGVFNQTSSRFGINTLGSADDSSSLIDAANGLSEYLSVSFSEHVFLDRIVLSSFTAVEQARVSTDNALPLTLSGFDTAIDVYYFSNFVINAGENLVLSHVLGNGFSFDSISVSLVTVTEPSSVILMMLAGLLLMLSRKLKTSPAPDSA